MTERLVRVQARWTEAERDTEDQLIFDLHVDDQDQVIQRRPYTFGFLGSDSDRDEQFAPFRLNNDGSIDFSFSENDSEIASESIGIAGRKVRVGEFFSYTDDDGNEHTYRIVRVVELLRGEKK